MSQLVLRVIEENEDVEILEYDELNKREYFSTVPLVEIMNMLEGMTQNNNIKVRHDLICVTDDIVAIGKNCIVIKQKGHKRIVTYENKAYKINFPNSIYFLDHTEGKVIQIEAYCYKEYEGLNTKIFKYAMPNMLTGNSICIGSAPREIIDHNFVETLEKIIFTQYTHKHVDNIKSFRETTKYFEYLSKNEFPYDLLIGMNKKLKDVLK